MRIRQGRWGWVLGALLAMGCHDPGKSHSVQASAIFDRAALDFGEVPVGEWRSEEVRIQNVGYVPFNALEALGLSSNPSFKVELDGGKVLPGEDRKVTVRFHPLREGALDETVEVATDADNNRSHQLQVTGVGTPTPVRIYPERVDYQTLEIDSDRTLELTVENPVDLPLTVSVGGDSAAQFEADVVTVPPFSTQKVKAKYFPRDAGQSAGWLEVRSCSACTPSHSQLVGTAVLSAFAFDPSPVPFENVPVHERTHSATRATNITWRAVEIGNLVTSDEAFSSDGALGHQTVESGASVEVSLEFAARHSGPAVGTLTLEYRSDKARASEVMLDARGGKPTLAVAPVALDFGELPVGGKVEKVVRVSNAGTHGNLNFLGVHAVGVLTAFDVSPAYRGKTAYPWVSGSVWPQLQSPPVPIAPGNDFLDFKVYFQPDRTGTMSAQLTFVSDDMFNPERTITLTGRARPVGPCTFKVLPQGSLDFGNVPTGTGAVLGFRFENAGTNECVVKDIHLSGSAGGTFFMPGGPLTGGVLIKDDSFASQIAFKAAADGQYQGELSITVNDPHQPVFKLPLSAVAASSCLTAAPPYLDFGPIRYDCSPTPRKTLVSNQCPYPVQVDSVQIGPGTSNQFSVVAMPPMPTLLAPGAGFEVETTYARTVLGQHYSPLWVKTSTEPTPLLVPMLAETNHEGLETERYIQGNDSQLDVLFVVSNSTTMQSTQDKLKAAFPAWLSTAASMGVNVRMGVTSTGLVPRSAQCGGGANGGEAGRLFPVDGSRARVVSSNNANAASVLSQNVDVGLCHNLVQGLETMRAALSSPLIDSQDDIRTLQPNDGNLGFLRATARLAVVFVSDEDDHSGFDPSSYIQLLRSIKGPGMAHRSSAYAIVPTDPACVTAGPPGSRFTDVAIQTGGSPFSVCQASYAPLLNQLLQRAAGKQADFRLTATPSAVADIHVKVDGVEMPTTDWSYDPVHNAVVFSPTAIPGSGQTVEVKYRSVCGAPPPP